MADVVEESVAEPTQIDVEVTATEKKPSPPLLLIVVGQPFSEEHKQAVTDRIATELLSWDAGASGCDAEQLVASLSSQEPVVTTAENGESLLEWRTDSVHVHVLLKPSLNIVSKSIQRFVAPDSVYRCLLYSGPYVAGSGSWLLEDGPFHFATFTKCFDNGCCGSGPIDVLCFPDGEWTASNLSHLDKRIRLNPDKQIDAENGAKVGKFFTDVLMPRVSAETVADLLKPVDVRGSLLINRPTLHIFQGTEGASAVFGVRGFSMLVDGGYPRRSCFWDFVRYMDRIDVALISHLGADNVMGMSSYIERLSLGGVSTSLGHVFFIAGSAAVGSGDNAAGGDGTTAGNVNNTSPLALSLADEGLAMVGKLQKLKIPVVPCLATSTVQPINLYQKIGFGSLDLYALNPLADSRELKEFLTGWGKSSKAFDHSHLNEQTSIGAIVVFKPATKGERPTRILFPGKTPLTKLVDGLERLKTVAVFQTPDGSEKAPAAKTHDKPADKATARPATAPVKQVDAKVAVAKDPGSVKEAKKPASAAAESTTKDAKKTTTTGDAKKGSEVKAPAHANGESKKGLTETKDSRPHPATSTPKKDAPKPAPPKTDVAVKSGAPAAKGKKADEPAKKSAPKADTKTSGPGASKVAPGAGKKGGKPSVPSAPAADSVPVPTEELPSESKDQPPKSGDLPLAESASESTDQPPKSEDLPPAEVSPEAIPELVPSTTAEEPSVTNQKDELKGDAEVTSSPPTDAAPETACGMSLQTETVSSCDGGKADEIQDKPAPLTETNAAADVKADEAESIHAAQTEIPAPDDGTKPDEVQGIPGGQGDGDINPIQGWEKPMELPAPADKDGGKAEAKGKVLSGAAASKRPATAERLNQTMSKVGNESTRSTANNGKNNRLSLQPKTDHPPGKVDTKSSAGHSLPAGNKKPVPSKPGVPFYVDVAYVPSADICGPEFFNRVRARYYIVPGVTADARVLPWLAAVKSSWEGEVTVIPAGYPEAMLAWAQDHESELADLKITLGPSVWRATLRLESGDSCMAYRIDL